MWLRAPVVRSLPSRRNIVIGKFSSRTLDPSRPA